MPCIGFGMGRLTLDLQQGNGSLLCWELLLHAVVCVSFSLPVSRAARVWGWCPGLKTIMP